MDAFGVEPFVMHLLQFTALLHTGHLIIDEIDEFLVIAYDADLTIGNVNIDSGQTVDGQLFLLPHQRALAPDEVVVATVVDSSKGIFGRVVFDGNLKLTLLDDTVGRIVVLLEDQGVGFGKVCKFGDVAGVLSQHQFHLIIIKDVS